MKYSDCELYDKTEVELNRLEDKMTARQFKKWTVFRMKSLVRQSTFETKDWMSYKIKHIREYRIIAANFYIKKIKRMK